LRYFLLALLGSLSLAAAAAELMTGERLVRQLWGSIHSGNAEVVAQMIAPGFQAVDERGVRNREQEVQYLRGLKVAEYTLADVAATENGPVTVVTYRISFRGTLNGKPATVRSAPRLSVFVKSGDAWQWTAHANLAGAR
jgi:hypothetical protein